MTDPLSTRHPGPLPAAVVFDFDGVIADSEPLHLRSFQHVVATLGIVLSDEAYYAHYLGYDDEGAIEAVLRDHGRPCDPALVARLVAAKAALMPALLRDPGVLVPGAAACLERLARVLPVAIASGARRDEVELVLEACDLRRHVEVIVTAGETPRSKPAPDPYQRALALLVARGRVAPGTPPARCVAIEDSRWGLMSARDAGLTCVGLTTSYGREALALAHAVVDSLDEVTPEWLGQLVARC